VNFDDPNWVRHDLCIEPTEVSVVAIAKNEELRLADFLRHHRAIGVSRFFIVDNNSTDGTAEILKAQPDVVYFPSSAPFRENKVVWRKAVCDRYLDDRWILALDIDELFVYPGWPEKTLPRFIEECKREGAAAVFAPMVDMYSNRPLSDLDYQAGNSLIEVCPYFDSDGYRLAERKGTDLLDFPLPKHVVQGGPRERVFRSEADPHISLFWRMALRHYFGLKQGPTGPFKRKVKRRLWQRLKYILPTRRPTMSKIPLLKWDRGMDMDVGQHLLAKDVTLASAWGTVLHFKYLQDFQEKSAEAAQSGQYFGKSVHYQHYTNILNKNPDINFICSHSTEFSGMPSLLKAGLAREFCVR